MQNTKILEMLNSGKTEELKTMLQDEIFQDGIKTIPDAKKRYAAMKKYFKFQENTNESLQKPCKINYQGEDYYSFIDGYSIALTKESIGEIAEYDNSNDNYYKVDKLLSYSGYKNKMINLNTVLAEAKSQGYKFNKKEVGSGNDFSYVWYFENAYFKFGILEQAFSIINDGEEAEIYYSGKETSPIFIQTSIGICCILPVRMESNGNGKKVIRSQCENVA